MPGGSMIETALTISLICLAAHALFWEGMILFIVGNCLQAFICVIASIIFFWDDHSDIDFKISAWAVKPIFSCLICMSSIWGLSIGYLKYHYTGIDLCQLVLIICGINVILDSVIYFLRDGGHNRL